MGLTKIEEIDAKAIEQLNKDNAIAESLEVVKEVRSELVTAFNTNQEQTATIEQLSTALESYKIQNDNFAKTVESLSGQLEVFKVEKVKVEADAYGKRLEQLSGKFKQLGQDKSVEQLSKLSSDVIAEFEAVTSMAITKKSEEQLDIATIPTEGMVVKKTEAQPAEKADVFSIKGLCKTLQEAQQNRDPNSKRIIHM